MTPAAQTAARRPRPTAAWTALVVANLLLPLAIVTFAVGFFPYKPVLSGLAEFADTGPVGDVFGADTVSLGTREPSGLFTGEHRGPGEANGLPHDSPEDGGLRDDKDHSIDRSSSNNRPGVDRPDAKSPHGSTGPGGPEAPFDRLIFMVVDALRSDFVYGPDSGFSFTQRLIRSGAALPFTAHARAPTITMPRIKAITTGSIPSFVDVLLNFDEADTSSSLASQDTWLAQMKRAGRHRQTAGPSGPSDQHIGQPGGKLVMFGDDTWLKLFPGVFDRADGTSSFFVSDFTEVDQNVTRHLDEELRRTDWSVMVLHYLGLDHIGHKTGPRGPNMLPKQREMDAVVQKLYAASDERTLLVVCGDHGMNDAGNHGASSPGETSPALVFLSRGLTALGNAPHGNSGSGNGNSGDNDGDNLDNDGDNHDNGNGNRRAPLGNADTVSGSSHDVAPVPADFRYYSFVEQSDLAPTLAALLGFPIPKNNLGALIPAFLPLWPRPADQTELVVRNARQIRAIITSAMPVDGIRAAERAGLAEYEHKHAGPAGHDDADHDSADRGQEQPDAGRRPRGCDALPDAQRLVCRWARLDRQAAAMHAAANTGRSVPGASCVDPLWLEETVAWLHEAQDHLSSMASNFDLVRMSQGLVLAGMALVVLLVATAAAVRRDVLWLAGVYGVMMFGSSYVEEEHYFWYWVSAPWIVVLWLRRIRPRHGTSTVGTSTVGTSTVGMSTVGMPTVGTACLSAWALTALVATRVLRGWNQTGQKWAGKPDIATTYILPRPRLLWALVLLTYLVVFARTLRALAPRGTPLRGLTVSATVCATAAALVFKVSFTREDAPELVPPRVSAWADAVTAAVHATWSAVAIDRPVTHHPTSDGHVTSVDPSAGLSLVVQARIVYALLALALALFVVATRSCRPPSSSRELRPSSRTQPATVKPRIGEAPISSPTTPSTGPALELLGLLFLTQSRTANVPLFLAFYLQHAFLRRARLSPSDVAVAGLILRHTSFFALGGTNAISSVDLSNAYHGISGFNVALVGLLTFVSNWAGPIWWSLACIRMIQSADRRTDRQVSQEAPIHTAPSPPSNTPPSHTPPSSRTSSSHTAPSPTRASSSHPLSSPRSGSPRSEWPAGLVYLYVTSLATTASVLAVVLSCTLLRTHLFIWSVFSPKYLYTMAWSLGQHLVVDTLLTGLLLSVAGR